MRGKGTCVKRGDRLGDRDQGRMQALASIRPWRRRIGGRWVFLFLLAFSWSAASRADSTLSADIPAGPVAEALTEFARQTGLQLVYVTEIAAGRTSRGARAGASSSEALSQLLAGTGLGFAFINDRTVRIYVAPPAEPAPPVAAPVPPPARSVERESA